MSEQVDAESASIARQHIPGSCLLLLSRFLGLAIKLIVQVVSVRYLTKGDFGALAIALAFIATATSVSLLGIPKGVARFLPIYHERKDYPTLRATLWLAYGTVGAFALVLIVLGLAALWILQPWIQIDSLTTSLILLLVAIIPLDALSQVMMGVFAAFQSAGSIAFRRFLLTPLLRLLTVLAIVWTDGDVRLLAVGLVVATLIEVVVTSYLVHRLFFQIGLSSHLQQPWPRDFRPQELLGFSIPMMSATLLEALRGVVVIALIGYFHSHAEVARYQAVLPFAKLNEVVVTTFGLLLLPTASRLMAKGDVRGVEQVYWQSSVWVALLSFPALVMCCVFVNPVIHLLFGPEYRSSGIVLSVLAIGCFARAVGGLNVHVLRAYGHVRYLLMTDLCYAILAVSGNILLVPRWGALGGAVALAVAQVVQITVNQIGMARLTEVRAVCRTGTVCWVSLVVAITALVTLQKNFTPPLYIALIVTAGAVVTLAWCNRRSLELTNALSDIAKLLGLRRWLRGTT